MPKANDPINEIKSIQNELAKQLSSVMKVVADRAVEPEKWKKNKSKHDRLKRIHDDFSLLLENASSLDANKVSAVSKEIKKHISILEAEDAFGANDKIKNNLEQALIVLNSLSVTLTPSIEHREVKVESLISQIDNYQVNDKDRSDQEKAIFAEERLGKNLAILYDGIEDYEKKHPQLIANYQKKYAQNETPTNDPQYFRKKYLEFLAKRLNDPNAPKYQGSADLRESSPEKATISMEKFLGKEGLMLYHFSSEEEKNSRPFRNACLFQSTTFYAGLEWIKRLILVVSGPSSTGKTRAIHDSVIKACPPLTAQEKQDSYDQINSDQMNSNLSDQEKGKYVVAADGGDIREVCQMRKITAEAAQRQGFSGVSDLHEQSKTLESLKGNIQNAALTTETLGVVIPETFSKPQKIFQILIKLLTLEKVSNSSIKFARVTGDFDALAKMASYLGSRRAWNTTGFDQQDDFDLNKRGMAESKAYNSKGFLWGFLGSNIAETIFKILSPNSTVITVANDLLLKKEDPLDLSVALDAKESDEDVILISKRVFEKWENLKAKDRPLRNYCTLEQYAEAKKYLIDKKSSEYEIVYKKQDPHTKEWLDTDSEDPDAIKISKQHYEEWKNKSCVGLEDFKDLNPSKTLISTTAEKNFEKGLNLIYDVIKVLFNKIENNRIYHTKIEPGVETVHKQLKAIHDNVLEKDLRCPAQRAIAKENIENLRQFLENYSGPLKNVLDKGLEYMLEVFKQFPEPQNNTAEAQVKKATITPSDQLESVPPAKITASSNAEKLAPTASSTFTPPSEATTTLEKSSFKERYQEKFKEITSTEHSQKAADKITANSNLTPGHSL